MSEIRKPQLFGAPDVIVPPPALAAPPRGDAPRERDSKELNSIAASLNLEYDDVAIGWWLPAEPGPILCASVADAVREALRLADNDCRRATAALSTAERERDELRARLAAVRETVEKLASAWAKHDRAEIAELCVWLWTHHFPARVPSGGET